MGNVVLEKAEMRRRHPHLWYTMSTEQTALWLANNGSDRFDIQTLAWKNGAKFIEDCAGLTVHTLGVAA